jgi:hypothetical protein
MPKNKPLKEKIMDEFTAFIENDAKVVLSEVAITHKIKNEQDLDDECSKLRPFYSNHSREEILEELLLTKVGIKIFQEDLRIESAKVNTLLTKHVERFNKRIFDNEKRQVKTDKFKIHTKRQEIAKSIVNEMQTRINKFQPSDSKEFSRLLRARCSQEGLEEPSVSTISNYFKKYTGLSSTK